MESYVLRIYRGRGDRRELAGVLEHPLAPGTISFRSFEELREILLRTTSARRFQAYARKTGRCDRKP